MKKKDKISSIQIVILYEDGYKIERLINRKTSIKKALRENPLLERADNGEIN